MIKNCMKKVKFISIFHFFRTFLELCTILHLQVIAINIHEKIDVDNELSIRAFYAGHVLGAAMFQIMVGSESVLYTGVNSDRLI